MSYELESSHLHNHSSSTSPLIIKLGLNNLGFDFLFNFFLTFIQQIHHHHHHHHHHQIIIIQSRFMSHPSHHQIAHSLKGKHKEISIDHSLALNQLNKLLKLVHIPINLTQISLVTPSLFLAIIESILQRRFLSSDDSVRTSRSPHSRIKCLKVLIKVLNQSLDSHLDHWIPNSINLNSILQADPHQIQKIIHALIKLYKKSYHSNSQIHQHSSDSSLSSSQNSSNQINLNSSNQNLKIKHSKSNPKIPSLHLQSSTISSSSTISFKPTKINFEPPFSPLGPPLAQSSPYLQHHPSSLSSSSSSVTSHLSRSFNQQQSIGNHLNPQSSNPPTLRNLLGPLQAQMAAIKRPHTPRTAHRVMVNKLRNDATNQEETELLPNRDLDGFLNHHPQDSFHQTLDQSHYHNHRHSSIITLDGIEPDDPFVSIETRRALESRLIHNQTTESFDHTQWAHNGTESFSRTLNDFHSNESLSSLENLKPQPFLNMNNNPSSSSSSSSPTSLHSYPSEIFPTDINQPHYSPSNHQSHSVHQYHNQYDTSPIISNFGDHLHQENITSSTNSSELGLHQSNFDSDHLISKSDSSLPNPTFVPLPPSPNSSAHQSSEKVLLASAGAKLDLVLSDVIEFEKPSQTQNHIEGWHWLNIDSLALEAEEQRKKRIEESNSLIGLMNHKLKLLKLLQNQYDNLHNNNLPQHQVNFEHNDNNLSIHNDKNLKIRVERLNSLMSGGSNRINLNNLATNNNNRENLKNLFGFNTFDQIVIGRSLNEIGLNNEDEDEDNYQTDII
ncbi:hypothetical protein O181_080361 [Austropuccinia psidii MF-1]|uniref:Uncharacterized protein n=1 Tax=Austropuccinia psidii MF-1 TaxID=1389203 RepID=A0A9Q3FI26_9BASI|nr:hypothetical protein [Austropuccinia psidii MF-1]